MRTLTHRPGLSFEVAPPQRSHPNRTDIACFVGCVARRIEMQSRRLMPEVLARWVESQPEFREHVTRDHARLRRIVVQLDSVASFKETLQAGLGKAIWPDVVDRPALNRLIDACRLHSPVPALLVEALRLAGFVPGSLLGKPTSPELVDISRAQLDGWTRIQRLMNLPVRCESFETFATLFAWEQRKVLVEDDAAEALVVTTPMGSALRAFFGSGGRTCYVIVTGEPAALFAGAPERRSVLATVLPGLTATTPAPVTTDAAAWRGIEHVFGLDDVSFVSVPDLVDAISAPIPQIVAPEETLVVPERFQECIERAAPARLPIGRRLPPPRLSEQQLNSWKSLLAFTRALLDNQARSFNRRDVQLLASLPLAADEGGLPKQNDWATWLTSDIRLHSDRIQLAWPWIRTRESGDCQGGVEAPEGTLAGVLAASALQSGSYHSAARFPVDRLLTTEPELNLGQATTEAAVTAIGDFTLADRVCLIAPTARGPELVSDVTLAADPLLRAASVRRLVNVVIAQARAVGADLVFEPNGEALWEQIVDRINDLGQLLIAVGAVSSDAGRDAFVVRCGRTTMTQSDIDAGRVIVEIALVPAQPIVRIVVVLDLRDASQAS